MTPSTAPMLVVGLLLSSIAVIPVVVAVDTPWILGDEATVACYTLDTQEDIPKPVGLEMHWTVAPPAPLDSTTPTTVKYWARVQDNFWTHASNVALLGTDYSKYYRLCLNETGGCDTEDCCIWHSNVHSCRAESGGACEPWVSPINATDDSGSKYTLVTHTPSLVGGMEVFSQDVQLDNGDWVIIAHVKMMNFQCAVGATRSSVTPIVSADSSTATILAIGIPLLVVLVIAVVVVIVVVRKQAQGEVRDISDAPKDGQVTLIFTDIQDSTNLWSTYTASMALSLDIHHEVVRRCIKAHHGYEVKTAGDAFMIATKTPEAGLAIARDIQVELMKQQWPRCITQHYLEEELEDKPEELETAPTGAAWHGCRVRIGVHTGTPDITFDEVAKGYDYYGPEVNLAARVESAARGGQILGSQATRDAMPAVVTAGLTWAAQGLILPKGLSDPYPVFTAHLDGSFGKREFPELTLTDDRHTMLAASGGGGGGPLDLSNPSDSPSLHDCQSMGASSSHQQKGGGPEQTQIVDRIHEQFEGDVPSTVINAAFDDRLKFIQLMLKPLPKAKQGAALELVCNGWRTTYNRNNTTQTINQLVGRMLPAEKSKLIRDATVVQDFREMNDSQRLVTSPSVAYHEAGVRHSLSAASNNNASGSFEGGILSSNSINSATGWAGTSRGLKRKPSSSSAAPQNKASKYEHLPLILGGPPPLGPGPTHIKTAKEHRDSLLGEAEENPH